jgi:hypothetical protein
MKNPPLKRLGTGQNERELQLNAYQMPRPTVLASDNGEASL